jgi:phosphohistidine phosphatase
MKKQYKVCFFRHGIAVDRSDVEDDASDISRPLTDEGVAKTRSAAAGLQRLESFDKLFTSPWLRAKQTADILAEVLGLEVLEMPELAGDMTPAELQKAIGAHHGESTLLVGHEPLLSATVGTMLGAQIQMEFKKSGACMIQAELPLKRPATLLWLMTSKQLRSTGK